MTILRAVAGADMPDVEIKQGDAFYMAREGTSTRFRVVRWERTRWVCSCGKGPCEHKLQVNEFVFQESQKRRVTGNDLAAHLDPEGFLMERSHLVPNVEDRELFYKGRNVLGPPLSVPAVFE